jgi:arginyl-tRNA synthetase
MDSLIDLLEHRVGTLLGADAVVRGYTRSDGAADYQSNGVIAVAKSRGISARDLAVEVAAGLTGDGIERAEVAGPGFINLRLSAAALWDQVDARGRTDRLGVDETLGGRRVVVDYSQPNIAKEMHVGHLRSTVIGDALVRIQRFLGAEMIRQNHLGDWGTQFGMLIEYLREHHDDAHIDASGEESVSRLSALYRDARAEFEADPAFADAARRRVVALQSGDEPTLAAWRDIVAESQRYFAEVYDLLGVELTAADSVGESFYNDALPVLAAALVEQGVAEASEGALCVFFDGVRGPDGSPVPLIVRKSDGGFGYAATDLAAIRYRVDELKADRICYVVDARQALHFRMVFATARRAGWLPDGVRAEHVAFGTVLGPDGRPFKTRAGETVRLIGLLTEAVERAELVVREKNPELSGAEIAARAREVGIGAVKYADLSTSRTRDYAFDLDRMVSLNGNTSVYLQYAHARARSILRKAGDGADATVDPSAAMVDAERRLVTALDEFGASIVASAEALEPHRLCGYLFELAQRLTAFLETCPVLKAPDERTRGNRLALCRLTADTLATGLNLLGIAAPTRL